MLISDEIWSGLIGAISGAVTGGLVAAYQSRQAKLSVILGRFDDALNASILEATILWSRDGGEADVERATQLRATFLRLSGSVEDLLLWPRVPNRTWAGDVGRAHRKLRSEATGDAFDTLHRKAEPDRCERIRDAGQTLRGIIRARLS